MDSKEAIGRRDDRYEPAAFARLKREPGARRLARSWREQRAYLSQAVAALGDSPLAAEARARLRALRPARPPAAARRASGGLRTEHFDVVIDEPSGALRRLCPRATGIEFAGADHLLGRVWFEVFGPEDYARYARQYLRVTEANRWWAIPDYLRPGLETVRGLRHQRFFPRLAAIERADNVAGPGRRCRLALPKAAVTRYGAPAAVVLTWQFPAAAAEAQLTVDWFDQRESRIPAAAWCSFVPRLGTGAAWRLEKIGRWLAPARVVARGNRRLHAVGEGVTGFDRGRRLHIETREAALVAPGAPGLLDFHQRQPSPHGGVHVNLYNNVWGTNFPLWYGENARFRFRLRPRPRHPRR